MVRPRTFKIFYHVLLKDSSANSHGYIFMNYFCFFLVISARTIFMFSLSFFWDSNGIKFPGLDICYFHIFPTVS